MLQSEACQVSINNRFGVLLAKMEAREKRNIPLTEVHQKTKISRRALQEWANNTVTRFDAGVLSALCQYYGCGPGDLLEYIPDD